MKKTSVIVVTYNRLSLLKECIKKTEKSHEYIDHVFIVNNNSTDGTKEYLDEVSSNFIVPIHLKENIGGAGGFSYGIKYAYENSSSDYFLIMDDDTMLTDSTLQSFYKAIDYLGDDFGFLSSDVRWYKDGNTSYLNIPEVSSDWNQLDSKGLIKLKSASFVSFLTTRKVIKNVGLPIAEMFIWADDVEYSTRISRKYSSYFVIDSKVIHKCKNNDANDSIVNCMPKRIFYYECMFRNRMYLYRKHYSKKVVLKYIMGCLLNIYKTLLHATDHRTKRVKAVLIGITKGLFFNPVIKYPKG